MTRSFRMLIGGQLCDAQSGATFESINPATAQPWATLPDASEADVDLAVRAAQAAFHNPTWRKLTPSARGVLLRRLGDLVALHIDEIATLETRDNGKLFRETRGATAYIPQFLDYTAGAADKLEGATLPIDKPDMFAYTLREPLGVVAAIVPWNNPLYLTIIKLAPALAAGNTIVIKPSEHASTNILRFAELVAQAGIPDGVVNVVTGWGPTAGAALSRHPQVRKIAFTGGPVAARNIVRASAENLAMLSLELGGKSANIVFADANLDSAINGVVAGIYAASGQSCVAGSRLLVEAPVYDEFIDRLRERIGRIRIGDPLDPGSDMGPMATAQQLGVVESMVAAARAEGGEILAGGKRPAGLPGWYFEPTLVHAAHDRMALMRNEVFGPVAAVIRFSGEAEALALANATDYGLAGGIWTRDIGRALRLVRDIRTGILWVNTYRAISPMAPIGGFGLSGYGRECGLAAIEDYTETKTVWINLSDEPMGDPFMMR